MKQQEINVLIGESDGIQRSLMEAWLEKAQGIRLCPSAGQGAAGLEAIRRCRPDVVVWDAFLPGLDALTLLEHLAGWPPEARPRVIVTFWFRTPQLTQTLLAHGAGYLMDRPLNLSALERRIRMVAAPPEETLVETCLRLYGLSPDAGRRYETCRRCLHYCLSIAPRSIQLKQLEIDVSHQLNTSPKAVQKNLHRAVLVIHQTGSPAFRRIWARAEAPSNSVFLRLVTDDLRAHLSQDANTNTV